MFDFHQFLVDRFQKPADIIALFESYNTEPPKFETVKKWFQRKAVPSDWFAVLLAYLELDEGSPVKLSNYLSRGAS